MDSIARRRFLALFSRSAAIACLPFKLPHLSRDIFASRIERSAPKENCWLDLCAPFILEDSDHLLHSEIVLTSDTFVGSNGHADHLDATEYELYLYDSNGTPVNKTGPTAKLKVGAMQTTVIAVKDLIAPRKQFWGGLTVRLRPLTRQPMHASDLFSSAFVRWGTNHSFTTVHANPDPLEWQRPDSFFYSMPFPSLRNYECVYSLFNPYAQVSAGSLFIYDALGSKLRELPFQLEPHSSLLLNLDEGAFTQNAENLVASASRSNHIRQRSNVAGGTIAVINRNGSAKNFGYLWIKEADSARFSVEHPIHQPPFNPLPTTAAFDSAGNLTAKNVLYTPLVFRSKRIGGLTLDSRFHLSSGAPMEQHLWLKPFIVDSKGEVAWQVTDTDGFPSTIASQQIERGAIKLGARQSCLFDCTKIKLPNDFSGGLALAITPNSNHTLMKVEITAREWGASTFTHFRPGLKSARAYQLPPHREGLATDYIASGAQLNIKDGRLVRDEIIAIINIDDKRAAGNPSLEIFDRSGFIDSVQLGPVPPFSCRHYLFSKLLSKELNATDVTLRLVDKTATLLMSILHIDYGRRDIAADHGSDRFSTFGEFKCQIKV